MTRWGKSNRLGESIGKKATDAWRQTLFAGLPRCDYFGVPAGVIANFPLKLLKCYLCAKY